MNNALLFYDTIQYSQLSVSMTDSRVYVYCRVYVYSNKTENSFRGNYHTGIYPALKHKWKINVTREE